MRDVVGHLALGLQLSMGQFLWRALTLRSMGRATDSLTWEQARRPVPELVDLLRTKAESRLAPPGAGPRAPLTELIVHGLDLRQPLGLTRELPEERLRPVLAFLFETPARGFIDRAWRDGLRFEATDLAWSFGAGPTLKGPGALLCLAVTGRAAILPELQGDGVGELRRRFER